MILNKTKLRKYKPPVSRSSYDDLEKQKLLKEKISEASKAIRKKYLALKMGRTDEDETLNRIFKPITEPLKDMNKLNTKNTSSAKEEVLPIPVKASSSVPRIEVSPAPQFLREEVVSESVFSGSDDDDKDADKTVEEAREEYAHMLKHNKPLIDQYLEQFPNLSRYYIEGFFTHKDDYDENTGANFDYKTSKLYVGNKEVRIGANNDLVIDNKPYEGTKGLYNLIFLKKPLGYSDKDLKNYKEILEVTSAHRRNYDPLGQVKGNKHHKYVNIIKPLFTEKKYRGPSKSQSEPDMSYSMSSVRPAEVSSRSPPPPPPRRRSSSQSKPHEGSGMAMIYNEKPIEYVYWDDINELVDRLKLLVASKAAGNMDSHNNEILSIINELKEIGVIS